jgi:hypothetical protein
MKKLLVLLSIFFLVLSCTTNEKPVVKEKDDFLKVYEHHDTPTTQETTSENVSYWFVVVERKNGEGKLNAFIKQEHRYFSQSEAKAAFGGEVFILNMVKIDKETYEKN